MAKETQRSGADGAMELLGVGGFALFFGWMLITFYWLFAIFLQSLPTGERDTIQLFIFIGIALGYAICHFLGKRASYTPFSAPVLAIETVFAAIVPLTSLGLLAEAPIPTPMLCAANLLAGIGGGFFTVSWLDVCGRSKSRAYARFCSEALLGGGALFALAALMPTEFQPVFCLVYLALSVGLLKYTSENSDNSQAAPVSAVEHKPWKFAREVEPSFIAFGIVFGMTFVFLFNYGSHYVFIGLLATIPGALVLVALSLKKIFLNITVLQRILLFMTVLACICIPFSTGYVQMSARFLSSHRGRCSCQRPMHISCVRASSSEKRRYFVRFLVAFWQARWDFSSDGPSQARRPSPSALTPTLSRSFACAPHVSSSSPSPCSSRNRSIMTRTPIVRLPQAKL